ncbi:winged helix-turn-helix domain-containing protein [Demequina aurantiaca]|uniref:winged helix-turn-helix domain-containing protein n=1 Tax=Demequina aurantiaca TaxID=676200 RepID=UPI003D33B305
MTPSLGADAGAGATPRVPLKAGGSLSAAQARRVFLQAQGLARKRGGAQVGDAQFGEYLRRQGVLQLDSVNVLARAHYLPMFSRYGAYDRDALDQFLWGERHGHSAHAFEHWGHEASVSPLELLPAMHVKMTDVGAWGSRSEARIEAAHPGLIAEVRAAVEASGPYTAGDLDHLSPREGVRGAWWDQSQVKWALEHLFITGKVAATRRDHFRRAYDATTRGWGVAAADVGDWGLPPASARQALFDHAIRAVGISTAKDVADHFRLKPGAAALHAADAVARGVASWVEVEGWSEPALLAQRATDPGRATGAALLSPFDPVCWYRPRLERMFGMTYRIEIYTPAAKRVHGYYTLPFLLGDQIVGRFDLKADRATGTLRVLASWREEHAVPGARRRSDDEIAQAVGAELRLMAGWLGLGSIAVEPRGNLAGSVARASLGTAT